MFDCTHNDKFAIADCSEILQLKQYVECEIIINRFRLLKKKYYKLNFKIVEIINQTINTKKII